MPNKRKLKVLRAELRKFGFYTKTVESSHEKWFHQLLPDVRVILVGKDSDDADYYQEKDVREALRKLREVQGG